MTTRPPPDCRTCGACCGPTHESDTHVNLFDVDLRRLSPAWRRRNVVETGEHQYAIRTVDGRNGTACAALRGSVGHRVSCGIYARRPSACREYVAGSRDCIEARRNLELS